ncbi:TetR/AcrR family transcriptional regulator [Aquabacterium sp.]|uniref:TetR/AcrR family transcriptional regulator n=1 Tax=Aquabacterium sp. TaxID=1872578 RepID=UPI003D6D2D61
MSRTTDSPNPRPASAAKKPVPKGAGRPRAAEVEARLQDLKYTAGRLFLDKGYGNVSLEMIAREARVAVRTIYIKFGGKNGLLSALLQDKRARFFSDIDLDNDQRPLREVLEDFSTRLYNLLTSPEAMAMQRMLAAEARDNPQLVDTFFTMGPNITRDAIARFLQRPDVRAQLRDDLPEDQLPVHLINCVLGDQLSRVLRGQQEGTPEQCTAARRRRMELFYRSVLR